MSIARFEQETLLKKTKADAPSFVPLLPKFVKDTTSEYAMPLKLIRKRSPIARALSTSFPNEFAGAADLTWFDFDLVGRNLHVRHITC